MKRPSTRSLALGSVGLVGLVCLLAFQATSRADALDGSGPLAASQAGPRAHGPVWTPGIVTTPGLPVQCADGSWTRTVVRAGCARHGGVAP